jgi:hypothetical protein
MVDERKNRLEAEQAKNKKRISELNKQCEIHEDIIRKDIHTFRQKAESHNYIGIHFNTLYTVLLDYNIIDQDKSLTQIFDCTGRYDINITTRGDTVMYRASYDIPTVCDEDGERHVHTIYEEVSDEDIILAYEELEKYKADVEELQKRNRKIDHEIDDSKRYREKITAAISRKIIEQSGAGEFLELLEGLEQENLLEC